MPTALYGPGFSVSLTGSRTGKQLDPAQEELEFSEYGRSSSLMPGWYIVPATLAGVAVLLLWLL